MNDCDRKRETVIKEGIKQNLVANKKFSNKLLNDKTRKEYQIGVANWFSVLEDLEISYVDTLQKKRG